MASFFRRVLIYLGLAEDETEEEQERISPRSSDHPRVRRIFSEEGPPPPRSSIQTLRSPQTKVHVVEPSRFNDAQIIGDKFKVSIPVILNLHKVEPETAKRILDFASGLTYGLNGGSQRVAEKVFLLTPSNVEVSAEEKIRLQQRGLFNQF
ncbi:cell division protein SepF [Candidatus Hakubella thermalkaliphila]|uniref:Cell division protein SepF n=1 Tax=Candidatus Hakubella thermalkaliphila TaxID=2754717 RepID=A0A6V8P5K5_9ACTN|nr:cell division protein SepF [Candidatus Hakubella thermalkaliphila]GFP27708.1 cell division inhibitor SepF [Candidatus Hakubella thermalkaliphila]